MLRGKRILLGVSGSIAAYKAASLTRLLVKQGAQVQVVMTSDAKAFITPLTLSTLSKKPVFTEYFDPETGEWNNHVDLALWADHILIAPATANTVAKMAHGLCDNLLLAVYLSAKCPVTIAPAMDLDMYQHPTFRENIDKLKNHDVSVIDAESGELASGLQGQGRMAEPEHIVEYLSSRFTGPFTGKKVLINAGPTYEPIDPVRFIGNRSSGKMGVAIANAFAEMGANVTLILGPSKELPVESVECIRVETAEEMFDETTGRFKGKDITILSAAVADYKPAAAAKEKIKKTDDSRSIELVPTQDILATLGARKGKDQILGGFALETENEKDNAETKIRKKNLDFIVLNSLRDPGAGFGVDTNKVSIIDKNGKSHNFELKSKEEVAIDIASYVAKLL